MHVPIDERTDRWLRAAGNDHEAAELLRERVPHLACFHAQQSAEKALKALVTRLSGDAPQTYLLARLVEALVALGSPPPADVRDDAESLDKFYIGPRYPDALAFADASLAYKARDAATALTSSAAVLTWVHQCIAAIWVSDPNPP